MYNYIHIYFQNKTKTPRPPPQDPRQRPSASKLLQHPWIFPHYKRYVEETGDDLIGLFGPSTLPTAGPAAASPPPAAAAAAVAAPTSSTPVQTINRVTGGTSTTKPSTNGGGGMGGTPLRSPGVRSFCFLGRFLRIF